jgi:hypothetical protein
MRGDGRIYEIGMEATQARQGAILVRPRESAVTDNVGDQDCSVSPMAPPLGVTQNNTKASP